MWEKSKLKYTKSIWNQNHISVIIQIQGELVMTYIDMIWWLMHINGFLEALLELSVQIAKLKNQGQHLRNKMTSKQNHSLVFTCANWLENQKIKRPYGKQIKK